MVVAEDDADLRPPAPFDVAAEERGRALFARRCTPCHGRPTANHAPFALVTYEDTQAPYGTMGWRRWERMAQVIDDGGLPHMPPLDAGQLTAGDLDVLRAWFAACAPGLPEDGGDPGERDAGP